MGFCLNCSENLYRVLLLSKLSSQKSIIKTFYQNGFFHSQIRTPPFSTCLAIDAGRSRRAPNESRLRDFLSLFCSTQYSQKREGISSSWCGPAWLAVGKWAIVPCSSPFLIFLRAVRELRRKCFCSATRARSGNLAAHSPRPTGSRGGRVAGGSAVRARRSPRARSSARR